MPITNRRHYRLGLSVLLLLIITAQKLEPSSAEAQDEWMIPFTQDLIRPGRHRVFVEARLNYAAKFKQAVLEMGRPAAQFAAIARRSYVIRSNALQEPTFWRLQRQFNIGRDARLGMASSSRMIPSTLYNARWAAGPLSVRQPDLWRIQRQIEAVRWNSVRASSLQRVDQWQIRQQLESMRWRSSQMLYEHWQRQAENSLSEMNARQWNYHANRQLVRDLNRMAPLTQVLQIALSPGGTMRGLHAAFRTAQELRRAYQAQSREALMTKVDAANDLQEKIARALGSNDRFNSIFHNRAGNLSFEGTQRMTFESGGTIFRQPMQVERVQQMRIRFKPDVRK